MLPLYDENPTRTFPLFTIGLIVANVFVFLAEIGDPQGALVMIDQYALVPAYFVQEPFDRYPTVFSSMFMHAGFGHLAGNMLYLWIFGNNIEDTLGKFGFLLFYLLCGSLAALGHIVTDPNSTLPMVGASGAISGILGAYMVLFPHARVRTLVFLGFYATIIRLPAGYLLGIWILIQVLNNLATGGGGGVAWMAHIGGFIAGAILIHPFRKMFQAA